MSSQFSDFRFQDARFRTWFAALVACVIGCFVADESVRADEGARATMIVVVGVGGAEEYESQFHAWADRWQKAAVGAGVTYIEVGRATKDETSDRDQLQTLLKREVEASDTPLWIVMIGHGTFFRDQAKFNLRGTDVSASELATWLKPVQRPLIVINTASSSGPFINRLSGKNRVVVTGTKSGMEQNFARFGDMLSQTITDPAADLDHDDEVSLLEAYLSASGRVSQFYEQEGRLPTEQALLDDNADEAGTPSSFFRGIRAQKQAKRGSTLDGRLAHQYRLQVSDQNARWTTEDVKLRDTIESQIEELRNRKTVMDEAVYYGELEALMVKLAKLHEKVDAAGK